MGNLASSVVSGVSALWEAGIAGKTLAIVTGYQAVTLTDHVSDPQNFIINVGTVVVVYIVARRLAKTKIKDGTIRDLQDSNAAKDERIKEYEERNRALVQQIRQTEQAATFCKTEATEAKARYDELQKYTAQPAIERFHADLTELRAELAERYEAQIKAMAEMTRTLGVVASRVNSDR
jgi:glutaminase